MSKFKIKITEYDPNLADDTPRRDGFASDSCDGQSCIVTDCTSGLEAEARQDPAGSDLQEISPLSD